MKSIESEPLLRKTFNAGLCLYSKTTIGQRKTVCAAKYWQQREEILLLRAHICHFTFQFHLDFFCLRFSSLLSVAWSSSGFTLECCFDASHLLFSVDGVKCVLYCDLKKRKTSSIARIRTTCYTSPKSLFRILTENAAFKAFSLLLLGPEPAEAETDDEYDDKLFADPIGPAAFKEKINILHVRSLWYKLHHALLIIMAIEKHKTHFFWLMWSLYSILLPLKMSDNLI